MWTGSKAACPHAHRARRRPSILTVGFHTKRRGAARRCRLEPFKKLAATIKERFDAVVRGMLDHRSNAFVESMNGQLQQAKRAARGYRTARTFIAIAYLRLSRLKNLPAHPFSAAAAVR